MLKVLVVDDDADLRLSVATALSESHYVVDQAKDGEEGINRVRSTHYDLVLLDVNMPRMTGLEALKEIKAHDPSIIVIVLTAFSNVRDAVEATKEGAYNYLEKPIKAENLVYIVDKALKAQRMVRNMTMSAPVFKLPGGTDFIGQSSEMKRIFGVIDRLARVDTAVLIRGESGTGKELVAQALHFTGPRKDNRFVTINCSAIPETLIESEFFGHEKGAFTGADSRKIGKFQYADGGTLFLDEIGDISAGMQVKLLRVLQEKRFTPVGANREVEVNVRIVAATNRNLEEMVKKGEFREDLFYRLNVLPIHLPALRERKNDIDALTKYFIEKFNQQHKKDISGITPETMALLKAHNWPGNIRELENVIEHAFVIETENVLTPASLPGSVAGSYHKKAALAAVTDLDPEVDDAADLDDLEDESGALICVSSSDSGAPVLMGGKGFTLDINRLDFQANKEEFERQFLISALKAFKGRINQTALHANIPKKTLLRKLAKYGINAREYV
ncbi:MAG: two-component system response regulator [Bdellovibrionales bacterium RIFOXYC1_FULL_54_43]|nr:MAG: two-component system response regulator [Bdellovibrionales bacterium RIFOXYC1_FULL_54_43]OFZ80004.1 MAG: two-component system response regulator [Bdellovibrionales bacterium RIFOXYD1_FULL_55_31]